METKTKQIKQTTGRFKIEVKPFHEVARSIKGLIPETTLRFNQEGLKIVETDSGNVCLTEVTINKNRFSHYEINGNKEYTINTETLYDILKENKKDIVEIREAENKLIFKFNSGIIAEVDLINREADLKEVPENMNYKTEVKTDNKRFNKIIKHFIGNEDAVIFNSNDVFKIEAEKNRAEVEAEIKGSGKSKYSTEYLKEMVKPKISENVVLKFSNDYPLKMVYNQRGFNISFILAPRVER